MSKESKQKTREIEDYRERLIKQKEFLKEILAKVEKQILALEVERLHLKNTLIGTAHSSTKTAPKDPLATGSLKSSNKQTTDNSTPQTEQELNLDVPTVNNDFEEEVEDDELDFLDDIEI
ncbi:uncharacterized protein LOC109852852 [Pseudomyrmex gracilis]|uniref:uncharacterized protein LOC109852852 n=1 Tax=Pseudomyrmex gracilis TaxID=219809 RepID=UPI000994C8FC|nr:uncharacterized protein LOC109852852 [Pseudomyrmex gracilis]